MSARQAAWRTSETRGGLADVHGDDAVVAHGQVHADGALGGPHEAEVGDVELPHLPVVAFCVLYLALQRGRQLNMHSLGLQGSRKHVWALHFTLVHHWPCQDQPAAGLRPCLSCSLAPGPAAVSLQRLVSAISGSKPCGCHVAHDVLFWVTAAGLRARACAVRCEKHVCQPCRLSGALSNAQPPETEFLQTLAPSRAEWQCIIIQAASTVCPCGST